MASGTSEGGSVEFLESKQRLLKMLAFSAVFVAVGGGWVWTGGPESGTGSSWFVMVVMVLGLLMGLAGLVIFVPRLFGPPRVLLVLDDDGFDDRSTLASAGRVRWEEVTGLGLMQIYGNDFIAVTVCDAETLHRDRGPVGRLLGRVNRRWGDVTIADSTMPVPAAEILGQMHVYWTKSVAPQQPPGPSPHS